MYDDEMFYGEDSAGYHPDADHEIESQFDDEYYDDDDDYNDMMDVCLMLSCSLLI